MDTLCSLQSIAEELGATEMRAVATEVFRRAKNGQQYLERVQARTAVEVSLVPQEEEARLGWLTAVASQPDLAAARVISWDSGSGSFQITARPDGAGELQSYLGSWGSTIAAVHSRASLLDSVCATFD